MIDFGIVHKIPRQVIFELPTVFGLDLSITNQVVLVWAAAALTFVIMFFACRRRGFLARGMFQNFFEALIEFVDETVVKGTLGSAAGRWGAFILSLFFFILFSNLLGIVPVPGHVEAATSKLSVTAALAAVVFVTTIVVSLRTQGVKGFFVKFTPEGVPKYLMILVVPIEIFSWLAKPLSLAIRLFANMMSGHQLVLVFLSLAIGAVSTGKSVTMIGSIFPYAGAVVMTGFEVFVSFIQAFIFSLLAAIYIKEAIDGH